MSGLQVAISERISDRGPAGTFGDGGVDTVFFEQAHFMSNDDGRAIGESDDAKIDIRSFRGIRNRLCAEPIGWESCVKKSESGGFDGSR